LRWRPRPFREHARLRGEARQEFLEGLTRGGAGIEALLKALEENRISPRDFAAAQLQRLRGVGDVRQRERVVKLLGPPPASRADALAHALGALDLAGDAARGLKIYEAQCASCHRLGGAGHAVGPDLESVRSQPPEKLLVAIVDPNREVAPNYFATTVETRDGESYSGILVAESPSGVVLRQASGLEQRIDRADIATMRTDGRSLMPEGFEGTMTLQEIADLIQCVLKGGDL
jgi:putative heme-binding domain-containing protein